MRTRLIPNFEKEVIAVQEALTAFTGRVVRKCADANAPRVYTQLAWDTKHARTTFRKWCEGHPFAIAAKTIADWARAWNVREFVGTPIDKLASEAVETSASLASDTNRDSDRAETFARNVPLITNLPNPGGVPQTNICGLGYFLL